MSDIAVINRRSRVVVDDGGNRGIITHFFDEDGAECGPGEAVSCVAECNGKYHAIDLREFEDVFSQ